MSVIPLSPDSRFKEFVYEQLSHLGKAFSSPQRLVILNILSQGEHSVEALSLHSKLTIANVSRHLQLLKANNLVRVRREGRYLYYRLTDEKAAKFFIVFRDFACSRYATIQRSLEEISRAPTRTNQMRMSDVLERMEENRLFIIDVRPEEEFRESHIPGAVSIPVDKIAAAIPSIPRERETIVYCRGEFCILADMALSLLHAAGYSACRMNEGLVDWKLAGFPLSRNGG